MTSRQGVNGLGLKRGQCISPKVGTSSTIIMTNNISRMSGAMSVGRLRRQINIVPDISGSTYGTNVTRSQQTRYIEPMLGQC